MINFIQNRKYLFLLSLVFLIFLLGYWSFIFGNRLYIYSDIGSDTWQEYWPKLNYVYDFYQNPELYSFHFGIGDNVFKITQLRDPFNILLLLTTKMNIPFALVYIMLIKHLLVGLFFYLYSQKLNYSKEISIIVALLFSFSGFIVVWGQHYLFSSNLVLFSIFLYVLELLLQEKRYILFSSMIFIVTTIDIHELYQWSLFMAVYFIIRSYMLGYTFKQFVKFVSSSLLYYILALLLASFSLLPQLANLLDSPRISGVSMFSRVMEHFFSFDVAYITMIVSRLFSNVYLGIGSYYHGAINFYEDPLLFISVLFLFSLPFALYKQKYKFIIISVIVLIFLLIFSDFFVAMMNAFKKMDYRYMYMLIIPFILNIGNFLELLEKNLVTKKMIIIISLILLAINIVLYTQISNKSEISLAVLLLTSFFIISYAVVFQLKSWYSPLIILIVIELSVSVYLSTTYKRSTLKKTVYTEVGYFDRQTKDVVKYIHDYDKSFYRIEKNYRNDYLNESIFYGYNSTPSYTSINNSSYIKFLNLLDYKFKNLNSIYNIENNAFHDYMNVKYIFMKNKTAPLDGAKFIDKIGNIHIYENEHYVKFGTVIDYYIGLQEFKSLSMMQKNYFLQNSIVDSTNKYQLDYLDINESLHDIDKYTSKLSIDKINNTKTLKNDFPNVLELNIDKNVQIFLKVDNQQASLNSALEFELDVKYAGVIVLYFSNDGKYYDDRKLPFKITPTQKKYKIDIANLGKIKFMRLDIATKAQNIVFKNLYLNAYKLENKKDIKSMDIIYFQNNKISGNIDLAKKGLLFFPIPFDKNWKIYINDKEKKLLEINGGMSGIVLEKGKYKIKLVYEMDSFYLGLYISLFVLFLFGFYNIYFKKKYTKRGLLKI